MTYPFFLIYLFDLSFYYFIRKVVINGLELYFNECLKILWISNTCYFLYLCYFLYFIITTTTSTFKIYIIILYNRYI